MGLATCNGTGEEHEGATAAVYFGAADVPLSAAAAPYVLSQFHGFHGRECGTILVSNAGFRGRDMPRAPGIPAALTFMSCSPSEPLLIPQPGLR